MAEHNVDAAIEARAINVIRGLAMDAPHAASSGRQGTAMALAPLAHVLWTRVMRYDASAPEWPDRDRFVLSCGHASILQYAMLHLTGYGVTVEDLREFRQWGSRTPGHPEVGHTPGIEVTTGPLGQGFANAVGMAIAEQSLHARFGDEACDHVIWGICSDGDLSEGVSHEAASLAGHLGLGHLCMVYDDNHISIDGPTELALSDDAATRFRAYGWHVIELGEAGEDLGALEGALRAAREVTDRPSLVVVRTHIAFPSPDHTDDPAAHGLAFSADDIAATKSVMGLPPDESFYVPDDVLALYREAGQRGGDARLAWEARRDDVLGDRRAEWDASLSGRPLDGFADALPTWEVGDKVATRVALAQALNAVIDQVPGLVSGGADLTGNTGTQLKGLAALSREEPAGRLIHFGIREHAMGSVMNGMALHGGLMPIGGTFLVFSDYMRPAVRLAALMGTKVVFAWSHDSVGVGEDGPTHQPVEHVAALRAIPQLAVARPADANETAHALRVGLESDGPLALIMSRQNVPVLDGTSAEGVAHGAYVLVEAEDAAVTLLATGSEVSVAVDAVPLLTERGVVARVVSMPCWEWFEATDESYQAEVLPDIPTVSVEAQVSFGWQRWADASVSIDRFGASAPGDVVMRELGITPEAVAERAAALVAAQDERDQELTVGRLHDLYAEAGQSPWLDNLKRGWITSGEIERWVERGVRGITSNPSIFQKAMETGDDYDEQLGDLVGSGRSIEDAYWDLVVADIREALRILRPVHDEADGGDGHVSVEVDPTLARDRAGTEAAARHLDDLIDEPNLLVKIPATAEGVGAIEQMVAESRSINVTLIFSLARYDEVIEAYLSGLERAEGDLSGISSVASFFISRVDTEVDRRLESVGSDAALALRGTGAVTQGQLAYQLFLERFSGPRWDALAARGARVQRPLWASTSTKNPAYRDTLYVDTLIGPDTVNTLPDVTLEAFDDHGTVTRTVDAEPDLARARWTELGSSVDLDDVARVLEDEGVAAFEKSFTELLGSLDAKATDLRR